MSSLCSSASCTRSASHTVCGTSHGLAFPSEPPSDVHGRQDTPEQLTNKGFVCEMRLPLRVLEEMLEVLSWFKTEAVLI